MMNAERQPAYGAGRGPNARRRAVSKQRESAAEAIGDVLRDGMTIAVGGFGLSGNPFDLIDAVRDSGATNLTIVSNNMGVDGVGLGVLLENRQVIKVVASYVGENKLFAAAVPLRRARRRVRAAGHARRAAACRRRGHPGVLHAHGRRHAGRRGQADRRVRRSACTCRSAAITADLALVRAHRADAAGQPHLPVHGAQLQPARSRPRVASRSPRPRSSSTAIDPDVVVTPGIFVQRVVLATDRDKPIEQRTVRPRPVARG